MSLVDTAMSDTLYGVLDRSASSCPDAIVVEFTEGSRWTFGQLDTAAREFAAGLQAAGLAAGDRVAVLLGNRIEFLTAFFGCAFGGMVFVPLNLGWRSDLVTYALNDTEPRALVVDAAYVDVAEQALGHNSSVEHLIIAGDHDAATGRIPYERFTRAATGVDRHAARYDDLVMILYTSGTTGPSKGIMYCHRMALTFARALADGYQFTSGSRYFCCLPLFHANALLGAVLSAVMRQGVVVLAPRFSLSRFWQQVSAARATHLSLIGSMTPLLVRAEPDPLERDHAPIIAFVGPCPGANYEALEERFNVRFFTVFGLTDVGVITAKGPDFAIPGTAGRVLPGWEVQLVDDDDEPVPVGMRGECVVRPTIPFTTSLGYWRKPEATVEAWKNLWYHTGDVLRCDEDGWYYFLERKKDSIRHGGENVSAAEVEAALLSHPDVGEAAVYAVPSLLGEDDVMATIVPVSGALPAAAALRTHCVGLLASFAVPRYIRFAAELPKTQTQKTRKAELRRVGITADTWDAGERPERSEEQAETQRQNPSDGVRV